MKKIVIAMLLVPLAAMAVDSTSTINSNSTSTSESTVSYKDQPVAGAKAPNISINNSDVCVTAVAGGAQTNVLGISLGTTVDDMNCQRIKLARELRQGGMKVASVALLCQDPRVFQSMIMSGTPCPAKGKIGKEAAEFWNKYPELRPDYDEYVKQLETLIKAGHIEDPRLENKDEDLPPCGPTRNYNLDQCSR